MESESVGISPTVLLELALLNEIGRVLDPPEVVLEVVGRGLPVGVSDAQLTAVARAAVPLRWTRDPFDRLIVATARVERVRLLTRDRLVREHAPEAIWP